MRGKWETGRSSVVPNAGAVASVFTTVSNGGSSRFVDRSTRGEPEVAEVWPAGRRRGEVWCSRRHITRSSRKRETGDESSGANDADPNGARPERRTAGRRKPE